MKKIIMSILLLVVSITFIGCGDQSSAVAGNIQSNVEKISSIIKDTKKVNEEDMVVKEIYSKNNYATASKASTSNTTSTSKIRNIPKQRATTQIVKNNNLALQTSSNNNVAASGTWKLGKNNTIVAKSTWDLKNTNSNIEKTAQKAVRNSVTQVKNSAPIQRIANSTYNAKRISESNYDNSSLNNYISKIEDLYLMMNDAVCANNDCESLKDNILTNCNMLNALCKQIKRNEINLDDKQCASCNDLLSELNSNFNKIKDSKNDVYNQCSDVQKMNVNPNASLDQITAKYVKLNNCLDNKISYYSNILSVLTQLRCIITGVCDTPINENNNIESNTTELNKNTTSNTEDTTKNNTTSNQNSNANQTTNLNNQQISNKANTISINKVETNNQNVLKQNEVKNNDKIMPMNTKNNANSQNLVNIVNSNKKTSSNKIKNTDTYNKQTVVPNINSTNQNKNNNSVNNNLINNNNLNNNNNNINNNNLNNNANNNLNNSNIQNNVNTLNPNAGINGAPGAMANGIYGNGAYGNGIYGNNINGINYNGYGIHNYENGVMNPYRNTDTYKLPVNRTPINNGYAIITPLESEKRQNFKSFNNAI